MSDHFTAVASASRASQGHREIEWLLNFVQDGLGGDPVRILELGVHRGYSLEVWSGAWPSAAILGVDIELSEIDESLTGLSLMGADSHDPATVERVRQWFDGQPVDFLFIDGDHTLAGVSADYEEYTLLVRPGGAVALHDACYEGYPGVVQVNLFVAGDNTWTVHQDDNNGVAAKILP